MEMGNPQMIEHFICEAPQWLFEMTRAVLSAVRTIEHCLRAIWCPQAGVRFDFLIFCVGYLSGCVQVRQFLEIKINCTSIWPNATMTKNFMETIISIIGLVLVLQ